MLLATRYTTLRQAQCYLRPSNPFNRAQQSIIARLLSSLAVLEHRDGKLQSASTSAITAAQKLGGPITGFVAGKEIRSVAEEAAKVNGLEKVIVVENAAYKKVRLFCRTLLRLSMIVSNHYSGSAGELRSLTR